MQIKDSEISVIIPLKNEEDYVEILFENLFNCSLKSAEIIIIDAGSTDKTNEKVKYLKEKEFNSLNIKLVTAGLLFSGGARNLGFSKATNNWILFLDAGIQVTEDYLSEVKTIASDTNSDFIQGSIKFSGSNNISKSIVAISYKGGQPVNCLPGSLISAALFRQTGDFLPNLRAFEDNEYMLRLKKNGVKIDHHRKISLIYDHLPELYYDVFKKWYKYQISIFGSPVFFKKALFYTLIIPMILVTFSFYPISTIAALFIILFTKSFVSLNIYQQEKKSQKGLFLNFTRITCLIFIIEFSKILGTYVSLFKFTIFAAFLSVKNRLLKYR